MVCKMDDLRTSPVVFSIDIIKGSSSSTKSLGQWLLTIVACSYNKSEHVQKLDSFDIVDIQPRACSTVLQAHELYHKSFSKMTV